MAGFFKRLREELFGKAPVPKDTVDASTESDASAAVDASDASATAKSERDAYFVQIGLDFGTAFCKCVCRDVTVGDRAWVHLPDQVTNTSLPFLISSNLSFSEGKLSHANGAGGSYAANGMAHIKMALEKVALEHWDDPALVEFKKKAAEAGNVPIAEFVEGCAVYLLAGILGGVRKDISGRFEDDIKGDYQAVNMAVPVANAEDPKVSELFNSVLRLAWVLADEFCSFRACPWPFLSGKITAAREMRKPPRRKRRVSSTPKSVRTCSVLSDPEPPAKAFTCSRTRVQALSIRAFLFFFGRRVGRSN